MAVPVAAEFILEMMLEGYRPAVGLECVRGLPRGATFIGVDWARAGLSQPTNRDRIYLIFSYPEWKEVEPGKGIPILVPVYQVLDREIFDGLKVKQDGQKLTVTRNPREVRANIIGEGDGAGALREERFEFTPEPMSLREQARFLRDGSLRPPNAEAFLVNYQQQDYLTTRRAEAELTIKPEEKKELPTHPLDIYIPLKPNAESERTK